MGDTSSIVLISGPPGAGKSTVARLLAEGACVPAAYIEGDAFWHFIVKSKSGNSGEETRKQNARVVIGAMVAAAVRYSRGGYETILDFTIGPWYLKLIQAALKGTPLDYVVLCPGESTCAARAGGRVEGAIADYSEYRELHGAFGELGAFERHAIRDDRAGAAEVASQIRAGLAEGRFRVEGAG